MDVKKDSNGNYTFSGVNKDYYDAVFDHKSGFRYILSTVIKRNVCVYIHLFKDTISS